MQRRSFSSLFLLILASLCTLLIGCGGPRVTSDWRTDVDFSRYDTWSWHPDGPQTGKEITDLTADRIHSALADHLPNEGLQQVADTGSADLLVRWRARIERKRNVAHRTSHVGIHGFHGHHAPWYHGYGHHDLHTFVHEWDQAVLTVDLLSAQDDRLLWQASTVWHHDDGDTPAERRGLVERAVTRIFEVYPPQPED